MTGPDSRIVPSTNRILCISIGRSLRCRPPCSASKFSTQIRMTLTAHSENFDIEFTVYPQVMFITSITRVPIKFFFKF